VGGHNGATRDPTTRPRRPTPSARRFRRRRWRRCWCADLRGRGRRPNLTPSTQSRRSVEHGFEGDRRLAVGPWTRPGQHCGGRGACGVRDPLAGASSCQLPASSQLSALSLSLSPFRLSSGSRKLKVAARLFVSGSASGFPGPAFQHDQRICRAQVLDRDAGRGGRGRHEDLVSSSPVADHRRVDPQRSSCRSLGEDDARPRA
jgi:hypothetical protein